MGKIHVKSALKPAADGGNPVALWDVDARHEGGELYIAGPDVVEVEETAGVTRAIDAKRIKKVEGKAAQTEEAPASTDTSRTGRNR